MNVVKLKKRYSHAWRRRNLGRRYPVNFIARLRAIAHRCELSGTCYIELLPSVYRHHSWNKESLYFHDDVFVFFEPIIEKIVPAYSPWGHWGRTEIGRLKCLEIIEELDSLASFLSQNPDPVQLSARVRFFSKASENEFFHQCERSCVALAQATQDFSSWLQASLEENECITILGV